MYSHDRSPVIVRDHYLSRTVGYAWLHDPSHQLKSRGHTRRYSPEATSGRKIPFALNARAALPEPWRLHISRHLCRNTPGSIHKLYREVIDRHFREIRKCCVPPLSKTVRIASRANVGSNDLTQDGHPRNPRPPGQ